MNLYSDIEKINTSLLKITSSENWAKLVYIFRKSKYIFLCGNGGSMAVANHAETDINRLLKSKIAFSPSNIISLTSITNDYSYEEVFIKWLEDGLKIENFEKSEVLVIALSASGQSKNITSLIDHLYGKDYECFLFSNISPRCIISRNIISFGFNEYHLFEVEAMMLIYELIRLCNVDLPQVQEPKIA